MRRNRGAGYEEIVVPPYHPGVELEAAQQNEENEDFSSRQRFHQSATVKPFYDADPEHSKIEILR